MDLNVVPDPPTFRLGPDASDYTSHQSQLDGMVGAAFQTRYHSLGINHGIQCKIILLLRMKLTKRAGRGAALPKAGLKGANSKDKTGGAPQASHPPLCFRYRDSHHVARSQQQLFVYCSASPGSLRSAFQFPLPTPVAAVCLPWRSPASHTPLNRS